MTTYEDIQAGLETNRQRALEEQTRLQKERKEAQKQLSQLKQTKIYSGTVQQRMGQKAGMLGSPSARIGAKKYMEHVGSSIKETESYLEGSAKSLEELKSFNAGLDVSQAEINRYRSEGYSVRQTPNGYEFYISGDTAWSNLPQSDKDTIISFGLKDSFISSWDSENMDSFNEQLKKVADKKTQDEIRKYTDQGYSYRKTPTGYEFYYRGEDAWNYTLTPEQREQIVQYGTNWRWSFVDAWDKGTLDKWNEDFKKNADAKLADEIKSYTDKGYTAIKTDDGYKFYMKGEDAWDRVLTQEQRDYLTELQLKPAFINDWNTDQNSVLSGGATYGYDGYDSQMDYFNNVRVPRQTRENNIGNAKEALRHMTDQNAHMILTSTNEMIQAWYSYWAGDISQGEFNKIYDKRLKDYYGHYGFKVEGNPNDGYTITAPDTSKTSIGALEHASGLDLSEFESPVPTGQNAFKLPSYLSVKAISDIQKGFKEPTDIEGKFIRPIWSGPVYDIGETPKLSSQKTYDYFKSQGADQDFLNNLDKLNRQGFTTTVDNRGQLNVSMDNPITLNDFKKLSTQEQRDLVTKLYDNDVVLKANRSRQFTFAPHQTQLQWERVDEYIKNNYGKNLSCGNKEYERHIDEALAYIFYEDYIDPNAAEKAFNRMEPLRQGVKRFEDLAVGGALGMINLPGTIVEEVGGRLTSRTKEKPWGTPWKLPYLKVPSRYEEAITTRIGPPSAGGATMIMVTAQRSSEQKLGTWTARKEADYQVLLAKTEKELKEKPWLFATGTAGELYGMTAGGYIIGKPLGYALKRGWTFAKPKVTPIAKTVGTFYTSAGKNVERVFRPIKTESGKLVYRTKFQERLAGLSQGIKETKFMRDFQKVRELKTSGYVKGKAYEIKTRTFAKGEPKGYKLETHEVIYNIYGKTETFGGKGKPTWLSKIEQERFKLGKTKEISLLPRERGILYEFKQQYLKRTPTGKRTYVKKVAQVKGEEMPLELRGSKVPEISEGKLAERPISEYPGFVREKGGISSWTEKPSIVSETHSKIHSFKETIAKLEEQTMQKISPRGYSPIQYAKLKDLVRQAILRKVTRKGVKFSFPTQTEIDNIFKRIVSDYGKMPKGTGTKFHYISPEYEVITRVGEKVGFGEGKRPMTSLPISELDKHRWFKVAKEPFLGQFEISELSKLGRFGYVGGVIQKPRKTQIERMKQGVSTLRPQYEFQYPVTKVTTKQQLGEISGFKVGYIQRGEQRQIPAYKYIQISEQEQRQLQIQQMKQYQRQEQRQLQLLKQVTETRPRSIYTFSRPTTPRKIRIPIALPFKEEIKVKKMKKKKKQIPGFIGYRQRQFHIGSFFPIESDLKPVKKSKNPYLLSNKQSFLPKTIKIRQVK